MKTTDLAKLFVLFIFLTSIISPRISAQEITHREALGIASEVVLKQFPNNWEGKQTDIDIRKSLKTDIPFLICDVGENGFVLVAKNKKGPSVLAFSYESNFPNDLSKVPESFSAYLNSLKSSCDYLISGKGVLEPSIEPSIKASLKSGFIPPLLTSSWKIDSSFCAEFPGGSMLNASAVIAMGQVFRYFANPAFGVGQFCYLYGPIQEELCTNFDFIFNFEEMPDNVANEQVQMLLYYMAVSGKLQPNGADLISYAETLPEYFFYSNNMRRLEYWEHNFIPVLKHQLAMGRPVPAEWKGSNFVIDGYYDTDYFHFNFGLGGELDGFYLLDLPTVKTEEDHFLLNCFINYHPKSPLPIPTDLGMTTAGDSINMTWNIDIPDSLNIHFSRYILMRDGVIPILETTSSSVMVHPNDFGISSEVNCIAVFNTHGCSELSEPYRYISDFTLADIPSLELRQEINIQLGYEDDLNRIPFVGELGLVKKIKIDFQDQRGIDQLKDLKFMYIDGISIPGIEPGGYLTGLNYVLFHRCRQFDFTVFESTNSLNVIHGSDGLPYDMYHLRHNSGAGVITLATHDDILNNMGDLYGIDKYFPNLTFFDLYHMNQYALGKCYISYESFNDILPNIMGTNLALEHTSPSSFIPCYPEPARNANISNINQLSWQSNYNDEPNVFYNVYIGKSRSKMPLIAPFYTDNVYDYEFENNQDYYWRVEAFHSDTAYYSGVYHFSTHETMPMPFIENFDEFYAKCDVSFESPFWSDFGDALPQPTELSREIKRSGRYALEVPVNSDVGIVIEPQKDSAYQIEFYFQNNRTEFSIELLQTSISGDTLTINSKIGLFGDNLGSFQNGAGSEQFLFTPFDWNYASIILDMPSGKGILRINETEIASWNWNIEIDGTQNTNPFRGIRFSDSGSSGSGFIDDILISYTETTGIKDIYQEEPNINYSPLTHELILSDNSIEVTGLELIDLGGRKITTFACNGEQSFKLDESIPNGVFILLIKHRDGQILSEKISIRR